MNIKEKIFNLLIESITYIKGKNRYFIKSNEQYDELMKSASKDNNDVWTALVVFGEVFIKQYKSPSKINYNDVGDSPITRKGYWQQGKLHDFPQSTKIKYQNSAMTSENLNESEMAKDLRLQRVSLISKAFKMIPNSPKQLEVRKEIEIIEKKLKQMKEHLIKEAVPMAWEFYNAHVEDNFFALDLQTKKKIEIMQGDIVKHLKDSTPMGHDFISVEVKRNNKTFNALLKKEQIKYLKINKDSEEE